MQPRVTEIAWESANSTMRIRRPVDGVVVVIVSGSDIGEHGTGPFEELDRATAAGPIELFIDARASKGVTIDVSSDWARWMSAHRESLSGVDMLTGSRFVQLTANFVRNFTSLGEQMRIWTDAEGFDETLEERIAARRR